MSLVTSGAGGNLITSGLSASAEQERIYDKEYYIEYKNVNNYEIKCR